MLLGDTAKVAAGSGAAEKHIAANAHNLIRHLDSGQLMHLGNAGGVSGFMEQSACPVPLAASMVNFVGRRLY